MRARICTGTLAAALALPLAAPLAAQTVPPAGAAAPAPAAPSAPELPLPSLFAPTWRQFQIAGRVSSVTGDPARWQRYEDIRDGLLFTDVRYAREWEKSGQLFQVTGDNVGWRDQRFTGHFERDGRFRITGLWDEIPQFYSVDTRTPFASAGGVLTLDDAVQRSIQTGQANLNAYLPQAARFDLTERRDIGLVTARMTPSRAVDLTASFKTQRHVGELPWGASFGFSNDVEVALPYTSRANDLSLGAEWTNQKNMLRVAYDGSWFQNHEDTLVWDNPLRLDDSTSGPGRGRMSLWPSNQAQTVSLGGFSKFARRTQATGFVSYGVWSNDAALQPFTINSALPALTLPRPSTDASAHVFSTNLGLVSRPLDDWRFSTRLRVYDFANKTLATAIPQFVSYDTSVSTSHVGGPDVLSHRRTTFTADATWSGIAPLVLGLGYTRNQNGYDVRIFERTAENIVAFTADALGASWANVRAQVELADRTGSGLDEAQLVDIGEQPGMRHYDIANRQRRKLTAQVELFPREAWSLTATTSFGDDDYEASTFGLQDASFRVAGFGVDYQQENGLGAGTSYNYERYAGLHRSRSAAPNAEFTDPRRDWTTDSVERVHYFSIYLTPPRLGPNTEARLSYDYAYARASYVYGIEPGSPLVPPNQLPDAYNKLQEMRTEVRHRLNRRLAATVSYTYEPFRVYDFAMDPSVINGIVQPSSLVLGYVYRPYTAHAAVVGLLYFW
jgi:MtrB/PioB family decaheme-associated outer membrane protein